MVSLRVGKNLSMRRQKTLAAARPAKQTLAGSRNPTAFCVRDRSAAGALVFVQKLVVEDRGRQSE
jgi:hypothetical protein